MGYARYCQSPTRFLLKNKLLKQIRRKLDPQFKIRYKSIICDENAYFTELARYIHLNPLLTKLVKILTQLARYRWCGHGGLVGKFKIDGFIKRLCKKKRKPDFRPNSMESRDGNGKIGTNFRIFETFCLACFDNFTRAGVQKPDNFCSRQR